MPEETKKTKKTVAELYASIMDVMKEHVTIEDFDDVDAALQLAHRNLTNAFQRKVSDKAEADKKAAAAATPAG